MALQASVDRSKKINLSRPALEGTAWHVVLVGSHGGYEGKGKLRLLLGQADIVVRSGWT